MATEHPGGSAPEPSPAEQHRERRIWWTIAGVGVVLVAVIMFLMWPIMRGRLEAARKLDEASAVIEDVQTRVQAVDIVVRSEPDSETAQAAARVEPSIPKLESQLKQAAGRLDEGYDRLTEDEQRRATLVKAAMLGRVTMLEAAPPLMKAQAKAGTAGALAGQAWNLTLKADQNAAVAATEFDKRTPESAKTAAALNAKSEADLKTARELFSRAATAYPEARLGMYVAYADQRVKQIAIARKIDAAYAAGKTAEVTALIAAFRAADAKSAQMAGKLPLTPGIPIQDTLEAETKAVRDAYLEGKAQADEADRALKTL